MRDHPRIWRGTFRDIETQAVREVSKKSGIVIATGGGIV
ncbi:MAG: hypothetical protein IJF21_01825, partial [Clostridia bacterium]|nr:hypothetical protein [Clostridia bacterium]